VTEVGMPRKHRLAPNKVQACLPALPRRDREHSSHGTCRSSVAKPARKESAAHVETCGAHFPRLMSDADAFEHPAVSAISESLTV